MINYISTEDIPQGSDEWKELRNGLITGTTAYDLLTGLSVADCLAKKQDDQFSGNYYTKRGHLLENEAKALYSELHDKITDYGFIVNDKYPNAGYSPDGVICKDDKPVALVEVKCFNEKRHIEVYESLDAHIIAQIQFGLFITELDWCDLVLYNPDIEDTELSFLTRRVYPDRKLHDKFKSLLAENTTSVSDDTAIALAKNIEELELALNTNEQFKAFIKTVQELDAMKQEFKDYLKKHMGENNIRQLTSPDGKEDWQATYSTTHKVSCPDITGIDKNYTSLEEIPNAIIKDGKAYQIVPNLKAVRELDKIGATIPNGFEITITPRLSLKMFGKNL